MIICMKGLMTVIRAAYYEATPLGLIPREKNAQPHLAREGVLTTIFYFWRAYFLKLNYNYLVGLTGACMEMGIYGNQRYHLGGVLRDWIGNHFLLHLLSLYSMAWAFFYYCLVLPDIAAHGMAWGAFVALPNLSLLLITAETTQDSCILLGAGNEILEYCLLLNLLDSYNLMILIYRRRRSITSQAVDTKQYRFVDQPFWHWNALD